MPGDARHAARREGGALRGRRRRGPGRRARLRALGALRPARRDLGRRDLARLLEIPSLHGAKHSSLDRATELRRLGARDRARPEFRLDTGNDLAIDLVAYGSDYLLGLATFAPERFAARDAALAADSPDFLTLTDALQHLGNVAFREPVPAYKHAAAIFLAMTGGLPSDRIHPRAPLRPDADRTLLRDCALRLGMLAESG